ncbi:hypothetical protein P153DRAFT_288980 [Dothidotthia symphoricarpi CBS 119687]|uniref:Uncharacterized protein n=1 Tax=Dothidotthia symphoricarpi CBS 119687 TaxID=1392245 RepID=A0A6A6AHC7_9PLEO|nr:uncharacterized protein P153DRAFT_288980 [Dothidotthia symphoricarpi CBS 119687]KAF2130653.1 hypothetical protein P153DRAFT_288980 [Dothidotthia symphoricarpi CBS 119687]
MRPFAPWSVLSLFFIVSCGAEPIAKPEAIPQQFSNNAPFSGAIYIVNPDGSQVSAQNSNWCPSSASISCSNVNQPSWCCPANYACAIPANSNGLIGCCPSGSSCGGVVNVAQIATVTVYPQETTVVYAQPSTVVAYNQPTQVQAGFCATITMSGPDLPRAGAGACGTVLIVNGGTLKGVSVGIVVVAVLLQQALGRMYR